MQLLNSYFAFTWTLWLGISALFIRNRYLRDNEKIEEGLQQSIEQVAERVQKFNLANRRDYRNLQLHGTILNNLIFFNNRRDFGQENFDLKAALSKDLESFSANEFGRKNSAKERLMANISQRTLHRVKVTAVDIEGVFLTDNAETIAFEIIRESLLNLEKHTDATSAEVRISILKNGKIKIEISDNSTDEIEDALKSKSLRRLIVGFGGVLNASISADGAKISRIVEIDLQQKPVQIGESILEIRNQGLTDFALNFGRSAIAYGMVALPGYLAIGTNRIAAGILTLQNILIAIPAIYKKRFGPLLYPSVLLSLLVIPYFSFTMEVCNQIEFFPWIFNTILAGTFLAAIDAKTSLGRWMPIAILTLESLLLPRMFPEGCQTIFVGSLPAIPLIIFFAFSLINLRKNWVARDTVQVSNFLENSKTQEEIESQINLQFSSLVSSLNNFAANIGKESDEIKVKNEVSIYIQKIRAFLIASEQYESVLVREIHGFVMNRLDRGISTKFELNGRNFFRAEGKLDLGNTLAELDELLLDRELVISLSRGGGMKLSISTEMLDLELERKIRRLFEGIDIEFEIDALQIN
jgi:hypothetical protein